eukprot:2036844-Rhodomonas_salina.1
MANCLGSRAETRWSGSGSRILGSRVSRTSLQVLEEVLRARLSQALHAELLTRSEHVRETIFCDLGPRREEARWRREARGEGA